MSEISHYEIEFYGDGKYIAVGWYTLQIQSYHRGYLRGVSRQQCFTREDAVYNLFHLRRKYPENKYRLIEVRKWRKNE